MMIDLDSLCLSDLSLNAAKPQLKKELLVSICYQNVLGYVSAAFFKYLPSVFVRLVNPEQPAAGLLVEKSPTSLICNFISFQWLTIKYLHRLD